MNLFRTLCLALIALPLFGPVLIEPWIPLARNPWDAKELMAMFFIVAISIRRRSPSSPTNLVNGLVNPFILVMMIFLVVSIGYAPPIQLMLFTQNMGGVWMWQALSWVFGYFLFYQSICTLPLKMEKYQRVITAFICWPAVINAGYALIQAVDLDQFQTLRPFTEIGWGIKSANMSALIGNPTYVGIYLAICIPFFLISMRWYWTALVMVVIVATQSDVAIVGSILTMIFMACVRARSTLWLKTYIGIAVLSCVLVWGFWADIAPKLGDNGRFIVWKQTLEDWRKPAILIPTTPDMPTTQVKQIEMMNKRTYTLTGRGIGSYPFLTSMKYKEGWEDPHNAYLRSLYEIGLIGLVILLLIIGFTFKEAFQIARENRFILALYSSFFFICLAAFFMPMLNIEPLRFFVFIIFSLLSSAILRR